MRPPNRQSSDPKKPELAAHQRLALSVIECAVKDITSRDPSLSSSAATFLNGSARFRFWAHMLEQDAHWLLRALQARLHRESPRAFERLSQGALALPTTEDRGVGPKRR